jgi:hypothetical protein
MIATRTGARSRILLEEIGDPGWADARHRQYRPEQDELVVLT